MNGRMRPGLPVRGGLVHIQGISFPIQDIENAMALTGGVPVVQKDLVNLLNGVMKRRTQAGRGGVPDSIVIEAIPAVRFVPLAVKLHHGKPGTAMFDIDGIESEMYLYFAVGKVF